MSGVSASSSAVQVLHIEDNLADILLTRKALGQCQTEFNTYHICSGDKAEAFLLCLARGDTLKPDLILLDLDLPQVSGHDLLSIIKGENELRSIRVIVLTGMVYAESLLGGYRSCVEGILTKPSSGDEYQALAQEIERVWLEPNRNELTNQQPIVLEEF